MYNKIVDALKGIARDGLRMNMMVRRQTQLASVVSAINSQNNEIINYKKQIARENFKQTQIVDTDPDNAEKNVKVLENIDQLNKCIESTNKLIENLNKDKKAVEDSIKEVEDGKILVDLDKLNELTKELILEVTKDSAIAKAKELSA